MAQEAARQQEWHMGADFWLSIILGLVLLALNAAFYFQGLLAQILGWNVFDGTGFFAVRLSYLLLCFLGFLVIGLSRGRGTWNASAAARLSVTAGLIGILPVIVVSLVLGIVLMVRYDWVYGAEFFVGGIYLAPFIGCSEILISVAGAQLGRVIGSRFLHRRDV